MVSQFIELLNEEKKQTQARSAHSYRRQSYTIECLYFHPSGMGYNTVEYIAAAVMTTTTSVAAAAVAAAALASMVAYKMPLEICDQVDCIQFTSFKVLIYPSLSILICRNIYFRKSVPHAHNF